MLALLFALAGPAAHATTVLAVDLDDQAAESVGFVEAVVGRSFVERGERVPYTYTELRVVRVIAGEAPDVLTVRQVGGTINGHTTFLPGDARLVEGQRVAAFVNEHDGFWAFPHLAQSVWHLEGEGPKSSITRDTDGAHFMERGRTGAVVEATESPFEYANFGELSRAASGLRFGGGL